MPLARVNGVELFYKESGSGREAVVFSHGLLMDHEMFEPQRPAFDAQYRVIAYDHRAQGQSQDTSSGYDMDTLANDAAALIETLKAAPCHFAGLSMGGFVGLRLAARRPDLVRSLTLMNTSASREKLRNRLRYGVLAQIVKVTGPAPFVGIAKKELFGRSTRNASDLQQVAMLESWTVKLKKRPRNISQSLLGVMNRKEVSPAELSLIHCPVLIITGEEDTAQPPGYSEQLSRLIPNSKLVKIPLCGHSSSLEAPEGVTKAIRAFLRSAQRGTGASK